MSDSRSISPLPAATYVRVSDYKQLGGRFDSCEAQLQVCQDFIRSRSDWLKVADFIDPAHTAKNMIRPGMQALREAVAAGEIKVVVSYKIERLLRSADDWPEFREFLRKHDCALVSVSEGEAENTAAGRFRTNMLVSVAAYERENTSEKVKNKRHLQAQKGIWNGGMVPYGYEHDRQHKVLRPHAMEAAVILRIFMRIAELVSLATLAKELNEEGIRTRVRQFRTRQGTQRTSGRCRIRSDWLRMLIRNPLYRGVVTSRGQEFAGLHPALVSTELWEAANAAVRKTLKPARSPRPGRDRNFNVLKGLLFCGECGRAMVPHASGKLDGQRRPYRYYTCNQVQKERADAQCRVRHVCGPTIEASVVSLLGQLARRPEVVEAVLAAGKAKSHEQRDETEKKLRRLNTELGQLTKQLHNLVDALANSGLEALSSELQDRIQQLTTRKDALLVERARTQQDLDALQQEHLAPSQISAALMRFDRLWDSLTPTEKRELVHLAIARIEIRIGRRESSITDHTETRMLQLRVKLHLPELLAAGGGAPVDRRSRLLAIDAAVQMPKNGTGGILITAPFKHQIGFPGKKAAKAKPAAKRGHPLQRAVRWKRILDEKPTLTARSLAKKMKISEATMSMTLNLLRLAPEVRERILSNIDHRAVRHMGLRMLGQLATKSLGEQQAAVSALMSRWA